jgi:hypothetical protein
MQFLLVTLENICWKESKKSGSEEGKAIGDENVKRRG